MILRRVISHFRNQEWTAIALDFLIVVVGILLAFQITEWNEARKDRLREGVYLNRIAVELDESIASIEDAIQLAERRAELGELLIQAADNPGVVRADPGRFVFALLKGGYTYSPNIRGHTFEEIKSVGDLGVLRDEQLRFDLTEFYTRVSSTAQWDYLREIRQTEYTRRAAGILTLEQIQRVAPATEVPEMTVEEALATHARMMERPAFIEWLPFVAYRGDDLDAYSSWLESAENLKSRLQLTQGFEGSEYEAGE
jgi:hypothetical protein